MLSFIDSFMHLTYIYPELNMVLDCGIQEYTRHRLSLQNLGEREEQLTKCYDRVSTGSCGSQVVEVERTRTIPRDMKDKRN